ncbi:MAG TPA: S41 family peptidase [Fimbriimonadaceae bacterium]|nr:S41 family peptidase [Fimbriimonadaceae bacterium]
MSRFLLSKAARGATALAFVLVAQLVAAQAITNEVKDRVLNRMSELITQNAYVAGQDFGKWDSFLSAHKEAIDKAETVPTFISSVNQALRQFGFSHIQLMSPRTAEARRTRSMVGIGVSIQIEPEGLRVVALFDDGPAKKSGIEVGDIIMEVDGHKAEDNSRIAGEEGTPVELKIKRASGEVKTIKVVRAKFSTVRPETLTWVGDDTAVLKVPSFDTNYGAKNIEKLFSEAKRAKFLVIDLRANGGGAVINMTHFLNHLLPVGTPVGTFVSRNVANRYKEETKNEPDDVIAIAKWSPFKIRAGMANVERYKGRIAVLIDGGTGSASEITAAALKENLNVPVVGSKSAGAVLASLMAPLPDGFMLQYPVTDYVTNGGLRLEGNGVLPDVDAPAPRFGEKDEAIEKALVLLQRAALRDQRSGGR